MKIFKIRPEDLVLVKEPIVFHLPIGDIPVVQKGFYLKQKRANDLIKFIEYKVDKKVYFDSNKNRIESCIDLALQSVGYRFSDIEDDNIDCCHIESYIQDTIRIDNGRLWNTSQYFDNYKKFEFIKIIYLYNNNRNDKVDTLMLSNIPVYDICLNYIEMYKCLEDSIHVAKFQMFLDYIDIHEDIKKLFKECTFDLLRNFDL